MVDDISGPKDVTKSNIYNTLSIKDKILFILYDYPNIPNILGIYPVTYVTSVTKVTYVTSVTSESNNSNNSIISNESNNRNIGIFLKNSSYNSIKTYLNRLMKEGLINTNKSVHPNTYSLSVSGREYVLSIIKKQEEEITAILKAKEEENRPYEMYEKIKLFLEQEEIQRDLVVAKHNGKVWDLDVSNKLLPYDIEIMEELLERPSETIDIFKKILKELQYDDNFIISNLPDKSKINITDIRCNSLNKLIFVIGEISTRSQSNYIIDSIIYECLNCYGRITIFEKNKNSPKCGCGGKTRIIEKRHLDYLKLTIKDISSTLSEEVNVFLKNDKFSFSKIEEGDIIELIGINLAAPPLDKRNRDEKEEEKIIEGLGVKLLGKNYSDLIITEEDRNKFEEIKKEPFGWFLSKLYPDLDNVELPCKMAVLCLFNSINNLFLGDPGRGKSEVQKRIAKAAIKGAYSIATEDSSSPVGLTGALTQNKFTGKFVLSGGIFKGLHPNGIAVVDEINREGKVSLAIQQSLLGIIANKTIKKDKANTNKELPCDVSIMASANLKIGRTYDQYKPECQNFNILDALFDRFDFVVYFNNELIAEMESLKKFYKSKIDNKNYKFIIKDLELIKKYQSEAKKIDVDLSDDETITNLAKLHKEHIISDGSYRRSSTILLLESICRLHLRNKPISDDFKTLSDMIINLKLERELFIENHKE